MWNGEVEEFSLKGHPYARHAFGWLEATNSKRRRPFVILKMWPAETPEEAVQSVFEREFHARSL